MICLNYINGAQTILFYHQMVLISKFENDLVGVEMGIAYGGGVEALGTMWKGRGTVYGFDTFENLHPDFLSKQKYSLEARCMDRWYDPRMFGTKALNYKYMRKQLDREGLDNVILVKGLVNKDSCKNIPKIHYVLLDMDILESMKEGYMAVIDKVVPGGFIFIHDALPEDHLPNIHNWLYKDVLMHDTRVKVLGEWPAQFLVGLEKI